jgi:hypothetical protein
VGTLSLVMPLPPGIEIQRLHSSSEQAQKLTWPCPYDVDLIRCCTIYCRHTGESRAKIDGNHDPVFWGILAEHGG